MGSRCTPSSPSGPSRCTGCLSGQKQMILLGGGGATLTAPQSEPRSLTRKARWEEHEASPGGRAGTPGAASAMSLGPWGLTGSRAPGLTVLGLVRQAASPSKTRPCRLPPPAGGTGMGEALCDPPATEHNVRGSRMGALFLPAHLQPLAQPPRAVPRSCHQRDPVASLPSPRGDAIPS